MFTAGEGFPTGLAVRRQVASGFGPLVVSLLAARGSLMIEMRLGSANAAVQSAGQEIWALAHNNASDEGRQSRHTHI